VKAARPPRLERRAAGGERRRSGQHPRRLPVVVHRRQRSHGVARTRPTLVCL